MKIEVCILAGGLSSRLGQDKAHLRFGRRTMLSIIRSTALNLGYPMRVIRRDVVTRCGPLGGILTALQMTRADAVLFLACDMPLVTTDLLRRVIKMSGDGFHPALVRQHERVGFPFILPRAAVAVVQSRIARKEFSVHALASVIKARILQVPARNRELFNVNTLADAAVVRELLSPL